MRMSGIRIAAFVLILSAALLPTAKSAAQTTGSSYQSVLTYDPMRNPANDLKQAVAEAERSHRRILLDVGGQWCIWCKYLDGFFDSHPDLKALRDKNYVWMKVNFSRDNENKDFLAQYPSIPGYPHIFVLTTEGRFYHSQETSPLEEGKGYSPERVKEFLEKWAPPQDGENSTAQSPVGTTLSAGN
jgi:thiol:disulfide interchange protein